MKVYGKIHNRDYDFSGKREIPSYRELRGRSWNAGEV